MVDRDAQALTGREEPGTVDLTAWQAHSDFLGRTPMAQKEKTTFRIDLIFRFTAVDPEGRHVQFIAQPHPQRYEERERNGETYYYDKFDDIYFPKDVFLEQLASHLQGSHVSQQRPQIASSEEYVAARLEAIRSLLSKDQPHLISESKSFLDSLSTRTLEFAILSLDIAGSTRLANTLPASQYARIVSALIHEASRAVTKFHGYVLKHTGDGLIAYFPAPSIIRMNDLAVDCALTIRQLTYDGLNTALHELGWGPIDIRIGIDSGQALIEVLGSPEAGQQKDIVGQVVNLACKIQSVADAGGVALGESAVRMLHTMWRNACVEIQPNVEWPYTNARGAPYRVYAVMRPERPFGCP